MGVGRSKASPISFDEAVHRVKPKVYERIEETFRRSSTASGYLPQASFIRDVIGDSVPEKLSEALYRAFGGTQKGLIFKDLLCGLVLIVHGTKQEKAKFIAQMISEDGEHIKLETLQVLIAACDVYPSPVDLNLLFNNQHMCRLDSFVDWILSHPNMSSFSSWLLVEDSSGLDIEGEPTSLTFHQALAQTYGVSEKDVMDVEKTYWALKSSGKFDLEALQRHICPPISEELVPGLFYNLDINRDGHLDLSEVLSAVSIWCSRDSYTIHKYCFSVFDLNHDGELSREELELAIKQMLAMKEQNAPPPNNSLLSNDEGIARGSSQEPSCTNSISTEEDMSSEDIILASGGDEANAEAIADSAVATYGHGNDGLSCEEYCSWATSCPELAEQLPKLLFEISHVKLGFRPKTKEDESKVIGGYLLRFAKSTKRPGDVVFIISADWFKSWIEYTGYQGCYPPPSTHSPSSHKKKRKSRHKVKPAYVNESRVSSTPEYSADNLAGEEGIEMIEANEVDRLPNSSHMSTGRLSDGGSEASILSSDDALKPPPIDNSMLCVTDHSGTKRLPSLTDEGGKLLTTKILLEGKHYILLPEVIWKVLVSWYSSNAYSIIPTLPRMIVQNGDNDVKVDLYPIFFKLYRHTTMPPPAKHSSLPWPLVSLMHSMGFGNSPTPSAPIVSSSGGGDGEMGPPQPPTPRRVASYSAAFVKTTTLAEISERIEQMLHVKSEDLRLYDLTNEDSPVLLEEENSTIENLYVNAKNRPKDGYKLLIETRNKDNTWPEEMIALVKEVQDKDKDKEKTKPQQNIHVQPGATGLSNLGNTCFMNSALQCVSNAKYLTQYFQNKDHLLEINKSNPLGMQGVMAKRYGDLIHELWNGNAKSITPLKFRFTVGRCAPHFTGFQQQDAQELLALVLDGLHEDLNRVKDKAYKELNDSDGRPDEEVAQEAWEYHLSRNKSIIVDLFHGQLKSEVTCKVCQYRSVRFDPFTFLSLPLPLESTVNLEVIVMFLDGRQPVKYGLRLEIDDKYHQLKEELGKLCGVSHSKLLLVEVYSSNIRNWPNETTKIRSVLGGWLYAYELPEPIVLTTQRSESPDEILRKRNLDKLKRERTMSLKKIEAVRAKASRVKEKLTREGLRERTGSQEEEEEEGEEEEGREGGGEEESMAKRQRVVIELMDHSSEFQGNKGIDDEEIDEEHVVSHEHAHISELGESGERVNGDNGGSSLEQETQQHPPFEDSDEMSNSIDPHRLLETPSECYAYVVHRRAFTVEHYFVSNQKTRPMLFSTPLLVPCTRATIRKDLYASVWTQVKRLIIPDPPNSSQGDESSDDYPFQIKQVNNDGMNCSKCSWYRFCRGCAVPCDTGCVGEIGKFLAVDWDNTTLNLKYLIAQEKTDEHVSMESLKIIDTKPIDLYKCFKAFVREDQLGDEESWYCKKCKKHREAVKSLEIWRFPPILIIHLKRFRFVNGRWIKSQRAVTFPLESLDPLRYTVQNGNGSSGSATPLTPNSEVTIGEKSLEHELTQNTGVSKVAGVKVCKDTKESDGGESDGGESELVVTPCASGEDGTVCDGLEEGTEEDESTRTEEPLQEGGEEDKDGGTTEKVETAESIGCSSPQISAADLPKLYNLFAISCHTGMLGGGHYTSFAKNVNGQWYYFNDSSCKETTPERVEQESPYMLFYELQNIDELSGQFRAQDRQGTREDIGVTEDDQEYDKTIKDIKKDCVIQ